MTEKQQPEVKISGGRQKKVKEAEKKPRIKRSAWLLTISTLQRYKEDDPNKENDEEALEGVIRDILNNFAGYMNVLEEGKSWSKEHVKSVAADYTVEYGKKTSALHCHILIKVEHSSRFQIAYDKIRKKFEDELGITVYMNNRLVRWPNSEDFLLDYVDKMR